MDIFNPDLEVRQHVLEMCVRAQVLSISVGEISVNEALETLLHAGMPATDASFRVCVAGLQFNRLDIDEAISIMVTAGVDATEACYRLSTAALLDVEYVLECA